MSDSENPVIDAPEPKRRVRPQLEPGLVAGPARPLGPPPHSPRSNPMDDDFDYAEEFETLDLEALKSGPRSR